jgi:hypothetical protein
MLELAQKRLSGPVEKTYVDYNDLLARNNLTRNWFRFPEFGGRYE